MASLANRKMYWALYEKVIPCVVVKQDLKTATVMVLLENGATHETSAYHVYATEEGARKGQRALIEQGATVTHRFLGESEISVERRNELWEQAQVNGRTDDDLYARLLEQEEVTPSGEQGHDFTPGPWRMEEVKGGPYGKFLCVVAESNRDSVVQILWHDTAIRPVDEANARLIAAAPALYEALKEMDATFRKHGLASSVYYIAALDKARATLALVDGPQDQETK